jgi:GT2 family glycosyltransferase
MTPERVFFRGGNMKVAVIIATVGRPVEAGRWVQHCADQTLTPSELVYSIARASDLPDDFANPSARVITGRGGLTTQRNAGMAALTTNPDIIAFFDDDYVPSRYCLEGIVRAFTEQPDLVAVSGLLLADGINSAGISYADARKMVDDFDQRHRWQTPNFEPLAGAYGCNMAYRASALSGEQFDERLPLYGWQEDVDFSRRVARPEQIMTSNLFTGVHQGAKGGRTSGRKLGYSQVANIAYLMRKGTMPVGKGLLNLTRNMLINHLKALRPEPWIDRKGRVEGNWLAIADVLKRKDKPERILEM